MCGIAGFLLPGEKRLNRQLDEVAIAMADRIAHRGPDDQGVWSDSAAGIALSHRRLAIIDLSPAGHQPMISQSEQLVIAFNGEIYNFKDLRHELAAEGVCFRGHSDTETILEAFSHWGIERTLPKMVGMFAIALWDRRSRELTLIRDRLGKKPLYWGQSGGALFFGSELKALLAFPDWQPTLDRGSVASFLRHNYIPAPHSIYSGISKLEPGSILRYRDGSAPRLDRYWNLAEVAASGLSRRSMTADPDPVGSLDRLLRDAVKIRMISDVPLGALLSGGIDSSLVTALMQTQAEKPVRTFSIGFEEAQFNEAPYASQIAGHLGTEHTELYVRPSDALEVIPNLPDFYDEPFADSSQIPTYLVCRMTRQHVTVVLSGDGGDELFAGYNRYVLAEALRNRILKTPAPIRHIAGITLRALSERYWDALSVLIPKKSRPYQLGNKVHKLADSLTKADTDSIYRQIVSHWWTPDSLVIGGHEHRGHIWNKSYQTLVPDFTDRMQFIDTLTYLPDDILTKVDRASMAVSLEARSPLLDHRVVEYAWGLPQNLKLRGNEGKHILRELLSRYVPREYFERPKMGFGVPIDTWLRGPLRDWAATLLDRRRLDEQGLLHAEPIVRKWEDHLAGKNWAYPLWDVLMLQSWLDRYPS